MTALRDKDGNVIGVMDDGGRGVPICSCKQSSFRRVASGCQTYTAARAMDAAAKAGKSVGVICNKSRQERAATGCKQ